MYCCSKGERKPSDSEPVSFPQPLTGRAVLAPSHLHERRRSFWWRTRGAYRIARYVMPELSLNTFPFERCLLVHHAQRRPLRDWSCKERRISHTTVQTYHYQMSARDVSMTQEEICHETRGNGNEQTSNRRACAYSLVFLVCGPDVKLDPLLQPRNLVLSRRPALFVFQ